MNIGRKKNLKALLNKKYQLSLAVLVPFSLVLFAAGPLVIIISAFPEVLVRRGDGAIVPEDVPRMLAIIKTVFWVFLGVSLATGLVLSYSILAPIKKYIQGPPFPDKHKGEADLEEDFSILGRDFSQMMSSLGRHLSILSGMSGGVIAFDRDGLVTAMNPSAEKIFACRSRDALGKTLPDCGLVTEKSEMERIILDGLHRNTSYSSAEVPIAAMDGRNFTLGITTSLLKAADGGTTGLVANFTDLTSLRRMHEDLEHRLRLAGLGRLAAGVAHEVRNPLGAIKGMAQLIQEGLPESDPKKKYGRIIEEETDRLNRVVKDLLSLAQGGDEKAPCDINALLRQARDLARYALNGKHAEILDECEKTTEIRGDRGRLVQAFLNIFLNAFEAVPEGGTVRFRTSPLQEGDSIAIEIGNTGTSLSADVKARMFEPFYTTKEKGSGLGLAIAHQIVTSHGGAISAVSVETETVFRMVLPVDAEKEFENKRT